MKGIESGREREWLCPIENGAFCVRGEVTTGGCVGPPGASGWTTGDRASSSLICFIVDPECELAGSSEQEKRKEHWFYAPEGRTSGEEEIRHAHHAGTYLDSRLPNIGYQIGLCNN